MKMQNENGQGGNCAKYIPVQLIQSAWAERRASTLYSSIVYKHDFLPITTGSAACTYVFGAISSVLHFVSSSIP